MPNYKEASFSGNKYRRSFEIHIQNPLAPKQPTVKYLEHDIGNIDGKPVELGTDSVTLLFKPAAVIDLIDPDTLLPTGQTVPEGLVYLALFSKYIAGAAARDAYLAAYEANPPTPYMPPPAYVEQPEPKPAPVPDPAPASPAAPAASAI